MNPAPPTRVPLAPTKGMPRLQRYALFVAACTFVLVILGGNVTSRDAGLSVPGGFWVYDHFLWTFPYEKWVGNIFHEHIHRLKGSFVGLMCIGLCVWVWIAHRPGRDHARPWLRCFSAAILALVIVQGVMGALRVSELSRALAVVHGVLGQLFFCTTVVFAAALGSTWRGVELNKTHRLISPNESDARVKPLRRAAVLVLGVMLLQLVLGATMRHTGSGLAIPDFPTSYGGILPPTSERAIYDAQHAMYSYDEVTGYYTAAQVWLHFAHRAWALAVVGIVGHALFRLAPVFAGIQTVRQPLVALIAMVLFQFGLGMLVVWTGRSPNMATAHQAFGALTLATAALLAVRVFLLTSRYAAPLPPPIDTDAPAPLTTTGGPA